MKKITMLTMVLMLVSLGGCCWPYPPHDRGDDRYDSGARHDQGHRQNSDGRHNRDSRH